MATAMVEGRWNSLVSELLPPTISRADKTIRTSETAIMRKEKAMLPAVSRRALPYELLRFMAQ
jgi:hypothetical protein